MKTKNLIWIGLTFILTLSAVALMPAKAQTEPPLDRIYVNPPEIINGALTPGSTFSVDINIEKNGTYDVKTWSFILSWNPGVINVTNVVEGSFLFDAGAPEGTFLIDKRYWEAGYIDEADSILGSYFGNNGNGTLLTVTFQVLQIGETNLHLSRTDLITLSLIHITHTTTDGFFANPPPPSPADLAGRSAWPDYHHFNTAKLGTTQTLWAKIRNLGTRIAAVKVVFIYTNDGGAGMVESTEQYLAVGETRTMGTPLTVSPGKYQVMAQIFYRSYLDYNGIGFGPWTAGETKSFGFAVV